MEFEKKYKEAQKWIESIYSKLSHEQQMEAEAFFPELKESEDERIRKELTEFLKSASGGFLDTTTQCKTFGKWVAWLEKQGELVNSLSKGLDNAHEQIDSLIQEYNELCIKLEKQGEPNPYSGISLDYNGHTWGMCARDNGVDILLDKQLFKHLEKQDKQKVPVVDFKAEDWYVSKVDGKIYNAKFMESSEKQGEQVEINPSEFDLRLNRLLKQFESLPKEELANSLSFYLNVVQNDGTYVEEKQGEQKPAWSEEDKDMLENILGTYKTLEDMLDLSTEQDQDILTSMNFERVWLKSLKQRMADNHPNLTWEDIRKICLIAKNVHKYYGFWTQNIYEEILDRFNKPEVWT